MDLDHPGLMSLGRAKIYIAMFAYGMRLCTGPHFWNARDMFGIDGNKCYHGSDMGEFLSDRDILHASPFVLSDSERFDFGGGHAGLLTKWMHRGWNETVYCLRGTQNLSEAVTDLRIMAAGPRGSGLADAVVRVLQSDIEADLEADPDRRIRIIGYSMGGTFAVHFATEMRAKGWVFVDHVRVTVFAPLIHRWSDVVQNDRITVVTHEMDVAFNTVKWLASHRGDRIFISDMDVRDAIRMSSENVAAYAALEGTSAAAARRRLAADRVSTIAVHFLPCIYLYTKRLLRNGGRPAYAPQRTWLAEMAVGIAVLGATLL